MIYQITKLALALSLGSTFHGCSNSGSTENAVKDRHNIELPNEIGSFNLHPFNRRPAHEQVELIQGAGYDGMMISANPLKDHLESLREFERVPSVANKSFKIYSILWKTVVEEPLDQAFLLGLIQTAKKLDADIWSIADAHPGERELTVPRLQLIADKCREAGVGLTLYPHHGWSFETAEESLEVWEQMDRPEVKLSVHLCHELVAGNKDRLDEVVKKVAPHLGLVSINGVEQMDDFTNFDRKWAPLILPLYQGDYDPTPFVYSLVKYGYKGPFLLHNFKLKPEPEEYLPESLNKWREISEAVARTLLTNK